MNNKSIHLPGLNGLRAIAAVSVLWGHCFQDTFGCWGIKGWGIPFVEDGVTMFFVISGFLITYLLLHELQERSTISIPKFYMRRILRIWPIYFCYIGVCIMVLSLLGRPAELLNGTLWYYGLFAANVPFVIGIGLWPIVHYWSIGVEEQFYLFWPLVVKLGRKRILKYACVIGASWLLLKYVLLIIYGHSVVYRFVAATRFDCMMLGGVGAILYYRKDARFLSVVSNKWVSIAAWILLIASSLYAGIVPAPVRPQLIALITLLVIMSQLCKVPIVNLENRFFDFVGKISYGVYVIHPLVIFLLSMGYRQLRIHLPEDVQVVLIYLMVTVLTIVLAWFSYSFFEKPFLRLKSKFAVVQSRNHMDR